MISKPLFKQSCKANAISWTFVTVITCFMLATIITVLGGIDVNAIRASMTDMFVKDAVQANVDKQSMTYYDLTSQALCNYSMLKDGLVEFETKKALESSRSSEEILDEIILSKNFDDEEKIRFYKTFVLGTPTADGNREMGAESMDKILKLYNTQRIAHKEVETSQFVDGFLSSVGPMLDLTVSQQENIKNFLLAYDNSPIPQGVEAEEFYCDDKAQTFVTLNFVSGVIYNQVKIEQGEDVASVAKLFISQAINDFSSQATGITPQGFALSYIPEVLGGVLVEQSFNNGDEVIHISSYYNKDKLVEMSESAIVSYTANLKVKEQQIDAEVRAENQKLTDNKLDEKGIQKEVEARLSAYSKEYIASQTGTLLEELPADVAEALQELGSMDIYSLMIGSIFFRIAGLLLPIIYIIITANNLIATQVDTGSMAYVLSTPTKRKTVSFTQMLYLVSSLFMMFVCTTITGVVSLAIMGQSMTVTITDMLLFNLGAFITTFAISGICFLASSWFNRSKQSMAVGGGLSMFFLVATILGLFGSSVMPQAIKIDAMNAFNYISLISLFDTVSMMAGNLCYLWKLAILLGVGVVTYAVSVWKFEKKDLPL